MDKRKMIRTDAILQSVLLGLTVVALGLWFWLETANYHFVVMFLVLLSWQFFSGVYIAVELKRWYRAALPASLLIAFVLGILLIAVGLPLGVWVVLGLTPIISITNYVVGLIDFQSTKKYKSFLSIQDDRILDSGDLFE